MDMWLEPKKGKCNRSNLSFLTYGKVYDLYFDIGADITGTITYALKDDAGRWIQWGEEDFDLV